MTSVEREVAVSPGECIARIRAAHAPWVPRDPVLLLRTCAADLSSYGGFVWPASGYVDVPDWDWDPEPRCGGGLHGLLWGEGDGALLSWAEDALWLVVAAERAEVVDLDGKVKFPRAIVVHCGNRSGATEYLLAHGAAGRAVVGATVAAGDHGTATAGHRGTATAGDHGTATAGYHGTATAGDHGTATAGYRGTATAGDYGTATAGDHGTATAGYRGTATAGYRGTATAGYRGTATAGYSGTLILSWWDGGRMRRSVAYVGEDGIEPGVPYRLDDHGRFVRVA